MPRKTTTERFIPSTFNARNVPTKASGIVSMITSGWISDSNCAAMIT